MADKDNKPKTVEPRMKAVGKATIGVGTGILVIGYMYLATGSMTLAPILIIGGLITIGIGIYNL
jgi:hypothetical protein